MDINYLLFGIVFLLEAFGIVLAALTGDFTHILIFNAPLGSA
jgi:hypothetical protein